MIVNIPIERIPPHLHNPRKDLGDLTGLAASIKENGALQTMTIVPDHMDLYRNKVEEKRHTPATTRRLLDTGATQLQSWPASQRYLAPSLSWMKRPKCAPCCPKA